MDSVLVIDEDPFLLDGIERVLRGRFKVTLAPTSTRAVELLQSGVPFSAMLCDLRMPEIDGLALLRLARRITPDTVRIVMTRGTQLTDVVAAVNEGQVFRMLIKPCRPQIVVDALTAACEQHRLVLAERVLVEDTVHGSVQALAELFLLVQPAAFGRAMRLRRHVSDLARRLGIARKWDIEVAALLSQIGSVTLSAETLDRWYHGRPLSAEEEAQVRRLPLTAQELIANIPRLESVQEILRLQDIPASHGQLPPGARMLAIARDFDVLFAQGETAEHALAIMEGRTGRYDVEYLRAFRSLRGQNAPAAIIREIQLRDVTESMVFATDVHSPTGLLLIARGQRVTASLLQRIRTQWRDFAGRCPVRVIIPS